MPFQIFSWGQWLPLVTPVDAFAKRHIGRHSKSEQNNAYTYVHLCGSMGKAHVKFESMMYLMEGKSALVSHHNSRVSVRIDGAHATIMIKS